MKNFIKKLSMQGTTAVVVLMATFLSVSSRSVASGFIQGPDQKNYSVKYVGESDNGLVFNLKYSNPDAGKVQLTLKAQDGTVLFQNAFSEKELDKNIVLAKDSDADHVSFIIKTNKGEF